MLYQLSDLIDFGTELLVRKGMPPERARRIARAQMEIEAFGVTTHGVNVLLHVVKQVGDGMDAVRLPECIGGHGPIATYDGAGCVSVESILTAIDQATTRAREHGLALVSVLRAGWVGVLGFHLAAPARDGFLAMAWGQMSGWPCVAPFGGREGRLSTNPMAFAMPASPDPIVADFSTAAVASGKVWHWCGTGERPPEPLLLDADGTPTDDPNALKNGGTILPFGGVNFGFRGTALSMWIEALTAAAGGRPANAGKEGGQNVHVLAIDIDAMSGAGGYDDTMSELLDYVLSSAPARDSSGPVMPGQREWQALAKARKDGLHLDDGRVAALREQAELLGVPMPPPLDVSEP
jgi:LDH2 family malate/lactate/ureidoglycolate dehydrogenase